MTKHSFDHRFYLPCFAWVHCTWPIYFGCATRTMSEDSNLVWYGIVTYHIYVPVGVNCVLCIVYCDLPCIYTSWYKLCIVTYHIYVPIGVNCALCIVQCGLPCICTSRRKLCIVCICLQLGNLSSNANEEFFYFHLSSMLYTKSTNKQQKYGIH